MMIGLGNWKRVAAPSVLLALLVTSRADAGVLLRYRAEPGDSAAYQMVMEGNTTVFVADRKQATDINTEIFLKQEVEEVSDSGVISLNTIIESGRINVNGNSSAIPNVGQRVRTEMQPNGAVVNTVGMNQQLNLSQMQLVFPDDAVEIGSSWSTKIPPSLQVPVALEVNYKIVGFETIKDFKCIKILSQVRSGKKTKIEGLKLDVKADGVIYFAYEKGLMVKNEVKSAMSMVLKRVVNNKSESIITKMKMDMKLEWQY